MSLLWQWERERAGLWNAGSLAWQPLQPWKHSSCGRLHWASTGKGVSSVRPGLGRHSQTPASPCWTLAPGSWGGEVTVFSCVAQVSPADSTGQFQTIVRQMVLVKLSGSKMKPKDINTKVGFAWNWEQTEVGKRHERKELRITRMLCAQVWSSQIQI